MTRCKNCYGHGTYSMCGIDSMYGVTCKRCGGSGTEPTKFSKGLWKGQPIEELTREELEDAFVELVKYGRAKK